jgi:GH15 family glucan-1,4-alpha-glucosidase
VYGRPLERERILGHLSGFRGSKPVRVGNAASAQHQMDIYGEVVDAASQLAVRDDAGSRKMLLELGEYVCEHWGEPDSGIWESRSALELHTHSLLLCWVALRRLLDMQDAGKLPATARARYARTMDEIGAAIETRGWSDDTQSYASILGRDGVDASLILMTRHGYRPPELRRLSRTHAHIDATLRSANGLYRRNLDHEEGAFVLCGLWVAEYLALGGGSAADAEVLLRAVLAHKNDVGLFAEEVDPRSGEALGNFPLLFSHLGVINAALALEKRRAA